MIPLFKVFTSADAIANASNTLGCPMIGEGPKVAEFTSLLCNLFNNKNVICLNSCTSALTLALRLDRVDSYSVVLSTPFTMVATNCAIKSLGASIEWADVDPKTLCMNLDGISDEVLNRVNTVMITLVGGVVPTNLDSFYYKCRLKGISVILDCAHALNTQYKGKHISHYCDYACFSFQSIKHLHTVDGGAIVIRDEVQYIIGEHLKWFGMSRVVPPGMTRLQHQMTADVANWGYKFHLNDVAASIGIGNYAGALENIEKHRSTSRLYQEVLGNVPHLSTLKISDDQNPSWWVYGILVKDRSRFISYMEKKEIVCTPMWRRNDRYSTFMSRHQKLPGMDIVEKEVVFIPNGWWLTKENIDYIVNSIQEYKCD